MWIRIAVLFLILPAAWGQGCTLCADGSDPSGTIGVDDCSVIAEQALANVPPDSTVCTNLQTRGFQYCSCPSLPEGGSCSLCVDGFFDIETPNRAIPVFDTTCGDVLFSSDPELCQRNMRAQYYCGCPDVVPSSGCLLCSLDPEEFAPDQVLMNPDRRVPPTFVNTCQDYDDATTLFDEETCAEVAQNVPVDLAGFCGCPVGETSEISCTLCPEGSPLMPDVIASISGGFQQTCEDMVTVAEFVIDQQYCESTILQLRSTCCEGLAVSPTVAPSVAKPASGESSPVAETPVPESSSAPKLPCLCASITIALWFIM